MDIERVEIEIRTPREQYGYINCKYIIELDEEGGDTIEAAIRYVGTMHKDGVASLEENLEKRRVAATAQIFNDKPF